ncbi:MAG: D-alanine--D-alanine ligase family protein [bacterium]|nr:D-alanine--D-alanine ligase family protein [bacterium]
MNTIGVFFGSRSPEHDVSVITACLIIKTLRAMGQSVAPVYIDTEGNWYSDNALGSIEFYQNKNYAEKLKKLPRYFLDEEASHGKLTLKKKGWGSRAVTINLAFPAFHGSYGEDGTIQGLFEMFNVPYVGCGVAASAIAMDKIVTKLLYRAQNIPTANFIFFTNHEWSHEKERVMREALALRFPLFVKPARLGSSIGISKVQNEKELEFAIEVALHYDTKVIVEEGVQNLMDITCALLGNENPTPSLLQESAFEGDFFDYEEKYIKGGGAQTGSAEKKIVIPARLDAGTTKEIQSAAVRIFKLFGCSGMARVDFLYDKTAQKWYANEINTIPGTLYHHLWKASGIPFEELLKRLMDFARDSHRKKNSVTTSFASDVLLRAASGKLRLKE